MLHLGQGHFFSQVLHGQDEDWVLLHLDTPCHGNHLEQPNQVVAHVDISLNVLVGLSKVVIVLFQCLNFLEVLSTAFRQLPVHLLQKLVVACQRLVEHFIFALGLQLALEGFNLGL